MTGPLPSAGVAPVLELRGAHRRYGGSPVLCGVDLTLRAGEIVGVGGASGSGKSTLLRVLAGIDRPDAGQLLMDGASVWSGRRSRPAVPRPGFVQQVFQDPVGALDERWPLWRTVTEPLTAPGRPRLSRSGRRERARQALAAVGLQAVPVDARPGQLSVGQCQRVAIVRAMTAAPAVLLADEPTSALDAMSVQGVLDLLRGAADAGSALVVVSHDERVLAALCDRTLVLSGGRLEATATAC